MPLEALPLKAASLLEVALLLEAAPLEVALHPAVLASAAAVALPAEQPVPAAVEAAGQPLQLRRQLPGLELAATLCRSAPTSHTEGG